MYNILSPMGRAASPCPPRSGDRKSGEGPRSERAVLRTPQRKTGLTSGMGLGFACRHIGQVTA